MASYVDDYDQRPRRRRDDRPPYPEYGDNGSAANERRPRQSGRNHGPNGSKDNLPPPPTGAPPGNIPPPPLGSAMKRDGSRSRVPHLRPEFPDEASYLNGSAPDAERKSRREDRGFKNKRDGYESEEGEQLRKAKPKRRPRDGDDMPPPPPEDRNRRRDKDPDRYGASAPRDYDDRRGPPRRRDDPYDDEDLPPRRRGPRDGVEYGADPIQPMRRRDTDRPPPRDRDRDRERDRPRRRRDDYDDPSDEDDYRPRRHRSEDPPRRRRGEDDYYADPDSRDSRRRRQDLYDRDREDRRRDKSRRRYTDDEGYDDYDRRDRRGGRRGEPREIKVGKYDVGPMVDQGKKYYSTLAPIVTPIVMNYLRNRK